MQRRPALSIFAFVALWSFVLLGPASGQAASSDVLSGNTLFQTYCMACHGISGKGDGIAAAVLRPTPRDLTNDDFMSTRTDAQLVAAIHQQTSPHGALAMPDWQRALTAQDIRDLVAYVRTLHRPPAIRGIPAQGAKLYTRYCGTCHGSTGKADGVFTALYTPRPQDMTARGVMSRRTDADLYNVIRHGRGVAMPGWDHLLTPQEMWDLVAHIRHLSR